MLESFRQTPTNFACNYAFLAGRGQSPPPSIVLTPASPKCVKLYKKQRPVALTAHSTKLSLMREFFGCFGPRLSKKSNRRKNQDIIQSTFYIAPLITRGPPRALTVTKNNLNLYYGSFKNKFTRFFFVSYEVMFVARKKIGN